MLDIIEYYFSEKNFEVCRIDGSVKLDERRRQVIALIASHLISLQLHITSKMEDHNICWLSMVNYSVKDCIVLWCLLKFTLHL